ncbi:hypothetical protein [Streptomyces sp. NBC_01618]|uniref:hypothetical protein n=1 Tax=Streptomyces sp. NBC_01618 TaxID=2975900 RepID=UPI00386F280C|nr:hypothetical protein OH735_15905 [Streptomyces sp. NBC_01618]
MALLAVVLVALRRTGDDGLLVQETALVVPERLVGVPVVGIGLGVAGNGGFAVERIGPFAPPEPTPWSTEPAYKDL